MWSGSWQAGRQAGIDLLLTDPPYNVDVHGAQGVGILGDNLENDVFARLLSGAFAQMANALKPGGAFYVWHASSTQDIFERCLASVGLTVRQQLIWVKSQASLGRSDYHWQHEPLFYGWKDGAGHYFSDCRATSTVVEDPEAKLSTLKKAQLIALCEKLMGQNESTTILRAEKPAKSEDHPTIKPQAVLVPLIRNSTREGETVLDLFGGSGSTLIACEQTGRDCLMMELDPKYVDVIINRWETFTGEKAVKL